MKKIILLLISFFTFISINEAKVTDVNYKIDDYIVDASIDVSGNMVVKEVIKVKGSFNGYIRDLVYKNSELDEFDGSLNSFKGSSIYNATSLEIRKVGSVEYKSSGELNYSIFNEEINEFSECSESKNCYEKGIIDDGISLKMYNETDNGSTYFYIEYLLGNVVVLHNDVAELYYNFVGEEFDDDIKNYQLRVALPNIVSKDDIRIWAHGPLEGEVRFWKDDNQDIYYGGYLRVSNLSKNTPVDMRMTFPKNLILVNHPFLKKSGVDALDNILKVEETRADEANKIRQKSRIFTYGTYTMSITYIILTILLFIYIYLKYDKEVKTNFNMEYNRDFIDDYDVTNIEYLFDKKITEKAFSTSILNLIYKKNIKFEQLDKKGYKFIKENEDNLSEAEKKLMEILFDKAGNGKEVTLKELRTYAGDVVGTTSPFLKGFDTWKELTTRESKKNNFYENNTKIKLYFGLYSLLGFLIMFLFFKIQTFNILTIITLVITIVFLIYIITFNKRTPRGALDYAKWKAFKKFLNDFGRFDEKELPEITLWERYLVYASIFGIADKVCKTMKIKFNEMNYTNSDFTFDYLLWSNLNNSVTTSVHSSVTTAQSKVSEAIARSTSSSGGGFGGGFSSGGGFGGGGGGGRGF